MAGSMSGPARPRAPRSASTSRPGRSRSRTARSSSTSTDEGAAVTDGFANEPRMIPGMIPGMVIVGAGEAGARAAMALREQGWTGAVTLIGDEAGMPYERPPLSKAVMVADAAPAAPFILDEERLKANAITHLSGCPAVRIDRDRKAVVLADGARIPYLKLLLATGAHARRLSVPGASPDNVLYLRKFSEALLLREKLRPGARLVVIGGGFIGLE